MRIVEAYRDDIADFRARLTKRRLATAGLIVVLVAAGLLGFKAYRYATQTNVTAYFANTNGLYVGDNVKIMGVDVGKIDQIKPDGDKMKVKFHVRGKHRLPADVKAAILSPTLVSARFIQLAPVSADGPQLESGAVIPIDRTAVPVEWDDFRKQLEQLSTMLGGAGDDSRSGKPGPLARVVTSSADALSNKGTTIGDTITAMTRAMTAVNDGRRDMFATIRNLQLLVTALAASDQQMAQFNTSMADVTSALTNSPDELAAALTSLSVMMPEVTRFVGENRDKLSGSVARLSTVVKSLQSVQPDIEQLLHVGPNAFQNFNNIYQPAQGTLTGALTVTQFQNPLQFICGAIQSASGEGAAASARRCAEYVGPVLKNLAFNYPPVGINPIAGVQARPDQIDYSQSYLRPPTGMKGTSVPGVFVPANPAARIVRGGTGLRGLMGTDGLKAPGRGPR
ncbi:MAG TPA: MCE family protein [Gordonia sp. (in: high G+C Gram-positive bacteria)]|uniref:MCE family protein n=1 Tax=unclassified Gordonia (in: high G+C Gram-positive bacteria) TaxID=2657482 RepID=UPI000FBD02FD|nr:MULTISPECIES: MCE family protein [unclassified Gordonia (in: high G+C Gram-positive bacteria)]RUP39878.1 MAG: MCE family protein [Gordonia sp. (in: high G+C Gram-positive bacteria)]HNP56727.1 MCE family protein [Gordonia sp. (in: high G+C Gram-positive bacteria)]HRC51642.1 MCE family protein [Gordonia sp. (in: high G+C Gram-positive bacteria)]